MFTSLIDTVGRTRVATFFLTANPRSFHPEEVRKATGEPGPQVAVNLRHFAKKGFVKEFSRKGEVYYRLNPRYAYLEELRGFLVKKSSKVRDSVWQDLEKLNNVSFVLLTGLFTGQGFISTDLVIVGSPSPSVLKRVLERIEKEMRVELNYTIFSDAEFDQRVNMHERFTRDLFENFHLIVLDKRPKPAKKKESPAVKKK